jgi:uncharacterized membrane protein
MTRLRRAAFAAPVFLLLAVSAARADALVAVGEIWTGLVPYIVAAIGALISAAVGWLVYLVNRKLGLSIDDSLRDSLQTAAANAAGLVVNGLGNRLSGVTIDVRSELVADAVNYVLKAAPDAVAHFCLTPEAVAEKILALLSRVAGTAATGEGG